MNNIKNLLKTRRVKSILFFGFYLVFFLVLFIILKNKNITTNNIKNSDNEVWTINKVINLTDYLYKVEINDNGNIDINYEARKKDISYDLDKSENYYFLDIYNINKLIKNSKFMGNINNTNTYIITNDKLNEILSKEKGHGENTITVKGEKDSLVITLDLHEFLEKDLYNIKIEYKGVDNE